MKKIVRILALALILMTLAGCSGGTRTFTCRDLSMTIPRYLEDASGRSEFSAYTFTLDSDKLAVFGLQERVDEYPVLESYDLKAYMELVIKANGYEESPVLRQGNENYYYFTYDYPMEEDTYRYMVATFRSGDGFWMVQLSAPVGAFDEAACLGYLDSVEIN